MNGSIKIFDEAEIKIHFAAQTTRFQNVSFLYEAAEDIIWDALQSKEMLYNNVMLYGHYCHLISKVQSETLSLGHVTDAYAQNQYCNHAIQQYWYYEDNVPLTSSAFDLIISNLCLQFVNHFPAALMRYKDALRKEGRFMASLIGGNSFKELREVAALADQQLYGGAFHRIMPMISFETVTQTMKYVGFSSTVTHSEIITLYYTNVEDLLRDFDYLGIGRFITAHPFDLLDQRFMQCVEEIFWQKFSTNGLLQSTIELIFCHTL